MLKGGGPWDGTRNEVKLPPPPELGDMFRIGGEVGTAVRGIDCERAAKNRQGASTSELRSNTLLLRPEGWMARSGSPANPPSSQLSFSPSLPPQKVVRWQEYSFETALGKDGDRLCMSDWTGGHVEQRLRAKGGIKRMDGKAEQFRMRGRADLDSGSGQSMPRLRTRAGH
ncbi:hypothetical protein CGGC5_v003955 [Colletotrichum fructicola Nara gc5]|uniref:Uncharacterized protein n=1 Tax=Colletotrichum fructicola (strain Nara gc5) TaxID=1213859 RepID=A0A7J6JDI1_COLFN|nr:hypothetical protein CGGC5_v003955 [Colletotrichum fructicola Nara gc5]